MNKKQIVFLALCGLMGVTLTAADIEEVFETSGQTDVVTAVDGVYFSHEKAAQVMALIQQLQEQIEQKEQEKKEAEERAKTYQSETERLLEEAADQEGHVQAKDLLIKKLTLQLSESEKRRKQAEAVVLELQDRITQTEQDLKVKTAQLQKVLNFTKSSAEQEDTKETLLQEAQQKISGLEAKHVVMQQRLAEQQKAQQDKAFEIQQLKSQLSNYTIAVGGLGLRRQQASSFTSLLQAAPTSEEEKVKDVKRAHIRKLEEEAVTVSAQVLTMESALKVSQEKLQQVTQALEEVQQQNKKLARETVDLVAAKKESDVALLALQEGFENISASDLAVLKVEAEKFELSAVAVGAEPVVVTVDGVIRALYRFFLGTRKINPNQ